MNECVVLTEEVEMVFQSLCFWLKHAPGNASIGSSLMQVLTVVLYWSWKIMRIWSTCCQHTGGGLVGVKFWVVLLSLTFHVLPDSWVLQVYGQALYIFSRILGALHPLQKEGFIWLVLRLFKFTGGRSLYLTLKFCFVLQTGILRTVLQAFLRAGSEPQMEALREFLLLAMVSNFDFVLTVRLLKSTCSATTLTLPS